MQRKSGDSTNFSSAFYFYQTSSTSLLPLHRKCFLYSRHTGEYKYNERSQGYSFPFLHPRSDLVLVVCVAKQRKGYASSYIASPFFRSSLRPPNEYTPNRKRRRKLEQWQRSQQQQIPPPVLQDEDLPPPHLHRLLPVLVTIWFEVVD